MITTKIVRAKDINTGKVRLFLEYKTDSETSYRNYKHRVRRWGRKYGPYNTVKQEAGEAHFYDGGKLRHNVELLEVVEELDPGTVGVGYGNMLESTSSG